MSAWLGQVMAKMREAQTNGVQPKTLVLSPEAYVGVMTEVVSSLHVQTETPTAGRTLFGMNVKLNRPKEFCECCGAPTEPVRCGYCHKPSKLIEIQ